jgi:hypothetical protein
MSSRVSFPVALAALSLAACNAPSFEIPVDPVDPVEPPADPMDPMDPADPADPMDPTGPTDADGDGYLDVVDPSGELSPAWEAALGEREVNYSTALRTASLRLRGVLPTLVEIRYVAGAPEPRVAYEQLLTQFLEDARFTFRLRDFFRDTFRMGGGGLDSAPLFATQLVVEGRDFTELFTATEGNCPTFDGASGTFTAADCASGAPAEAGILTDPAVMRQFDSNLAFRRVRWVQEVFACAPFPAETGSITDVGGAAPYTAPWPFESIAGDDNGGRVDFHDTSSVICANCHATMNHLAPLFGRFDAEGMWQDGFAVMLPLDGAPTARRTDWLPEGEGTAWRLGVPVDDLTELGAALAEDPAVQRCTVTRIWNWAMGHGDVIGQADVVPAAVIEPLVADYVASGHDLRAAIHAVYSSPDFVRF